MIFARSKHDPEGTPLFPDPQEDDDDTHDTEPCPPPDDPWPDDPEDFSNPSPWSVFR